MALKWLDRPSGGGRRIKCQTPAGQNPLEVMVIFCGNRR